MGKVRNDMRTQDSKSKNNTKGKISDVALREEEILAFWNKEKIFEQTLAKDAPRGEFVFYDGPPFATGLPHHGHMLPSTIKDAIPRYRTMRGFRVIRRWGWDCHGLPLENIVEKELGLKTKKDIEDLGVEAFNEKARSMVLEYADDWKRIIPRLGRWADMEDDYKTMDSSYTESVWWVFSELNRKGLVYEGFKPMHLCSRCGTTLSNFEVNQGYKDIKDIAVTVKLELVDEPGTYLLVWTTTPWTLPGNMAAAVHKDFDYSKIEVTKDGEVTRVILAKERLQTIEEPYTVLEDFKGSKLVGRTYVPPFEYYKDIDIKGKESAWKIYHADYVTLENGTGAVHLAPAYGEEDMLLAQKEGIPVVHHVDTAGKFMPHITDLAGRAVKPKDDTDSGVLHTDADVEILKSLKEGGKLFSKENIVHSYPHCWRCDTPLLNYATSSWFVKVTDIKDKLVSENSKVGWVPEHIGSARFGNWLEGARDWAVSRQRYWGAPLPVWRNKKAGTYKVLGSLEEIKKYVKRSGNTYFLMRHGESESNVRGISSTTREAKNSLTEKGIAQVKDEIANLKNLKIDIIVASPFARTGETADILVKELGIVEKVIFDDRLGEVQLGSLDGCTMPEYHHFLGDAKDWGDRVPEGGESWVQVKHRAGEVLYDLERTHAGKRVLIVAHNSPLRMMMAVAKGEGLERAFDDDEDGKRFGNAEVRPLDFTPLPHNRDFVLDYHRPYIDEIELIDEDGESLVRVPDVFDCWFESGSMPYGQQHYPFENTDIFDPAKGIGYPADFISESVDQTRGWFYSLIVLGVALFGQSPYKNVITNGLVLAEDGRKMSKSLKNYPDLLDVVDAYGADTLRFFLLSSSVVRGEDVNFSEKNVAELARKNIGRLANVLSFYELYKNENAKCADALASKNVLDRWIVSRLSEVVSEVTLGMEGYELDKATRPISGFIDDLSVWYLRRSRERLKYGDADDVRFALATIRYVLKNLALVIAPSMPFFAEYLFRAVREEEDTISVHLASWPEAGAVDEDLISIMVLTRSFATEGLMLRTQKGVNVRQPLALFGVRHEGDVPKYWNECKDILADELNVKEVVLKSGTGEGALATDFDWIVTPALKAEGEVRELMRRVQDMRKDAGLQPTDSITLHIDTDAEGKTGIEVHIDTLKRTVNAQSVEFTSVDGGELVLEGRTYRVEFKQK